ncbi:hypothetical protein GE115_10155 [Agromyces sp. CFH 90414]|uniref:Uncharacterized protein n=1 Tax=Agromyces agglutinans TaxID=2662258 RepID=A0A6I2F8X4_9MICO|nr:hypothetical protein [Agromyces agglutinans]MRG60227.1 hypothetical protein [Agromyces agglutinans]
MSATTGFVEYREVRSTEPLRQGDVLEAVNTDASIWQRNLFVVTADCDLANEKHFGRITCVPLLATDDYLLELRLPRLRGILQRKLVGELLEMARSSDLPNLTEARALEWAVSSADGEIVRALGLDEPLVSAAERLIEGLRGLSADQRGVEEAVHALVAGHLACRKPPPREDARQRVLNSLSNSISNPPGDAMFLGSIAPSHEEGYFAYLRHLEQVWEHQIALGPSHRSVEYRRISRLQDRYAHALVQNFALVFMPIGMPPEYEQMRAFHSSLLGDIAS